MRRISGPPPLFRTLSRDCAELADHRHYCARCLGSIDSLRQHDYYNSYTFSALHLFFRFTLAGDYIFCYSFSKIRSCSTRRLFRASGQAAFLFQLKGVFGMVVEIDFDPIFEAAYQRWLQENIRISKGEHKKRLSQGLGYSEKTFLARVWWPAFGTFQHLYPEFEVRDFKDGVRFLDFSYIQRLETLYRD
jgi:hypothetical protein